jgi:hypothetical protein
MNIYDKGDLVRCSVIFATAAGIAMDPAAVKFQFTTPAGVTTIYTYGTDASLVKDSTGNYHVDVNADEYKKYLYHWYSTGIGKAAKQGAFYVQEGNF